MDGYRKEVGGVNEWERAMGRGLSAFGETVGTQALPQVDSTNLRLKEWAREGRIRPPYLLAADSQTAGRGRLGRCFVSPPGTGVYFSLLAAPPQSADCGKITVLASVAVCRAIEETTGLRPRIKWVNDLFLRGRKVCGILAEGLAQGVVVGIGINIKTPEGGFPESAGVAGALDVETDRFYLAGLAARHILSGLENLADPAIIDYYRARMPLIGKTVGYTENGAQKTALVTGVADDGGLCVLGPDGRHVLRTGEVTLGSEAFLGL